MKQTISKCDKCKRQMEVLIDVKLTNTHCKDYKKNEEQRYNGYVFFSDSKPNYPTIDLELCEDCTRVLLHWLGHPENEFVRLQVK